MVNPLKVFHFERIIFYYEKKKSSTNVLNDIIRPFLNENVQIIIIRLFIKTFNNIIIANNVKKNI